MTSDQRPFDLWFAEQIEALAVAVALALVLKFFVIEAFQIPTGSMQPTILGDAAAGIHDRVLADKITTMLRAPRRWEVMIFRLPYDERRLYIKRIVGLPGDTLEIAGGDVWVDGRIARKPDHVNASVLKDISPPRDGGMDIGRLFLAGDGVSIAGERAAFAAGARGELRLRETVRNDYLDGYDPDWGIRAQPGAERHEAVSDLELEFTARLDDAAGTLRVAIVSDEGQTVFTLRGPQAPADAPLIAFHPLAGTARGPAGASPGDAAGDGVVVRAAAGERTLPVGREVEIVARDVDRQAVLLVDGEEWARSADDRSGPRTDEPTRALASLALRGGGEVSGLFVRRDIYYLPRFAPSTPDQAARWEIPEDSFFVLGDNTQASFDSRLWEAGHFELRDGRRFSGFWMPGQPPSQLPPDRNPRYEPGGEIIFADDHGDELRFPASDVVSQRREPAPFIHRRYLLGKAMAVFWPVVDPFRWKLVR